MKTGFVLGCIGIWLISDAAYSIVLYLTADSHNGQRQSWKRDHWVRVLRAILGIAVVAIGYSLDNG